MNTLRTLCWITPVIAFVTFAVAPPAAGQVEADTIRVSSDKTIVIADDTDGRIIVRVVDGQISMLSVPDEEEDLVIQAPFSGPYMLPDMRRFGLEYGNTGHRIHRVLNEYTATMTDREEQQKLRQMEAEARRLALDARQEKGDERERLEADLEAQLEEIFDYKLQIWKGNIEELTVKVEDWTEELEERKNNREAIIERRRNQLLGVPSKYDW